MTHVVCACVCVCGGVPCPGQGCVCLFILRHAPAWHVCACVYGGLGARGGGVLHIVARLLPPLPPCTCPGRPRPPSARSRAIERVWGVGGARACHSLFLRGGSSRGGGGRSAEPAAVLPGLRLSRQAGGLVS